ncbi:hypothetical protein N7526_005891 [Penicillium atrosanguineum]|nr:hypothetical protein N7526_005891 [Penicillium atrosanguineum]
MDQSMTLIDAQVHFLEERLVLVHIPLDLYPYFFKAEEDLILEDIEDASEQGSDYKQPAFLNVSITPVEVSVICPRRLVLKYFQPLLDQLNQLNTTLRSRLDVSDNDYIAMQVLGQGLEAGKRVLELTSPLAMAGISIFFISTYFSDYIIVPLHSKESVVSALENRGFHFENATAAFINPLSPTSPTSERRPSDLVPPATPPPSSVSELQTRTFENLRKRQIVPCVDDTLHLVQCAAHHQYNREESSMSILRDALTTVLLVDNPRFLSLTLAALDPAASLLLEKRLLPRFARPTSSPQDYEDGSGLLLGSKEEYLIPIMLDLRIVCGVAGRLADSAGNPTPAASGEGSLVGSNESSVIGSVPALFDTFGSRLALGHRKTKSQQLPPTTHHLKPDVDASADAVEISFLSTARAGTIIVGEYELKRAIDALEAEKVDKVQEIVTEGAPLGIQGLGIDA